MRRYKLTVPAEEDLANICEYIARASGQNRADKIHAAIDKHLNRIALDAE